MQNDNILVYFTIRESFTAGELIHYENKEWFPRMKKIRMIIPVLCVTLLIAAGCDLRDNRQSVPGSKAPEPQSIAMESESRQEQSSPPVPAILTLTVPEGYTLPRIGMALEEMGVCTAMAFIDATLQGDYHDFPLIAAQIPNPNRCFALEGYLFPDTYQIYASDPPEAIIRRMLSNMESKIGPLRQAIEESGYTVDEILTLASIIEKEAFGPEYMPQISSVLHNRLNIGMQLQCDVTIVYVEGAVKPFITGDVNRYNEYYNTYKCAAIPAGAICNPGLSAIYAALYPAETDYFFFLTDKDNNYHFSATWEGHQANERKYLNAA